MPELFGYMAAQHCPLTSSAPSHQGALGQPKAASKFLTDPQLNREARLPLRGKLMIPKKKFGQAHQLLTAAEGAWVQHRRYVLVRFNIGVFVMKFLKKALVSTATVAAVGFAATAQAGVIVDLFTEPPAPGQRVDTDPDTAAIGQVNQAGPLGASVLGGWRDMSVVKTSGDTDSHARARVSGGKLAISNDDSVRSRTVITWDGSNVAGVDGASVLATGLGGVDLTFGGSATEVVANVFTADLGFNYKITLWDMDGSKATLAAGVQFGINDIVPSLLAHYNFSWFNLANGTYCDGVSAPPACTNPLTQLDFTITRGGNMGAIDFTKIGAVQLEFNSTVAAVDLSLGSIKTVPEPGALALVGLALLGAGAASRRRAVKG